MQLSAESLKPRNRKPKLSWPVR